MLQQEVRLGIVRRGSGECPLVQARGLPAQRARKTRPTDAALRDRHGHLGVMRVILLPWMPSPAIRPFWPKTKA